MNSYAKRGGAARRRFCVICKKPEGGGGNQPPPGCARVKFIYQSLRLVAKYTFVFSAKLELNEGRNGTGFVTVEPAVHRTIRPRHSRDSFCEIVSGECRYAQIIFLNNFVLSVVAARLRNNTKFGRNTAKLKSCGQEIAAMSQPNGAVCGRI